MSNSFAEFEDRLQRVQASRDDVGQLLGKMEHDLKVAEYNRDRSSDWALKIAHEAILTGCAALMNAHGYRAKVNGHHYVTIRFAQLALPQHTALFDRAEMLRRRRHQVSYGGIYTVSEEEVEGALKLTRRLAPILRKAALAVMVKGGADPTDQLGQ